MKQESRFRLQTSNFTGEGGYSLFELIIYISVVTIITFIAVQLTAVMLRTAQRQRVIEETNNNARFAVSRYLSVIRSASDIALINGSGDPQASCNGASCILVALFPQSDGSTNHTCMKSGARSESGTYYALQIVENISSAGACTSATYTDLTNSKVTVENSDASDSTLSFALINNGINAQPTAQIGVIMKYRSFGNSLLEYSVNVNTSGTLL